MSSGILLNLSSDSRTQDSLDTDDFEIFFNSPINLGNEKWEFCVVSANFWNTNPNISGTLYNNNYFSYNNGIVDKVITIQTGTYSTQALNAEIQRQITANGDIASNITFAPNASTLRVEITTVAPYTVDLGTGSLLYELLGYSLAQIAAPLSGYNSGANRANLNRGINNVYVRSDIVDPSGSYDSKIGSDILCDVAFQGRPVGSSVYIEKKSQYWMPVKRLQYIHSIKIRLSDQLSRRYSIQSEPLSVQIYLRPSKVEITRKLFDNFSTGIKDAVMRPK